MSLRSVRRLAAKTKESAFVLIAVLALLSATSALAQESAAPTGLYRIAGKVISSTDGHPLAGATVSIRLEDTAPGKPLTRNTTSTDDGRFEFTGLPAGLFTLQGQASNFLSTFYDDHDGFTTGITTGSTVSTGSLILRLVPKASLSGVIANEAGEPVQSAQVRLFRQSDSFGDGRIVPAGTQSTDDLGRFTFPSLAPADYLVAVTAQPWYAVHPQPPQTDQLFTIPDNASQQQQQAMRQALTQMRRQLVFGVTGPLDPSLDVAYPITYYPRGSDSTDAQPIPLRPGDSREISLQLSPSPAVTITIPREPDPPPDPQDQNGSLVIQRRPQVIPQLRVSIFGQLQPVNMQSMSQTQTATVLSGIPPGDYVMVNGNTPFNQSFGGTPIHLTGSDHALSTTLPDASALAHLHVALTSPSGGALTAVVPIGLVRAGSSEILSRNAALPQTRDDTVFDVPPGDYTLTVQPPNSAGRPARTWFIRGVSKDGKPLAANSIHLAAGDSPAITLAVVPGDRTLRGIVVHTAMTPTIMKDAVIPSEGASAPESRDPRISSDQPQNSPQGVTPAPGVFLLLIPTDEIKAEIKDEIKAQLNTASRRFWRQQSDLDGSFSFPFLAPGSYTLFAIDDGWTLDWLQPHALDRYLPAAIQITIPDAGPPVTSLPQPIPVQPK